MLGGHATVTPDRGLFLEETWRLHPDICAYTSELFYEGRLRSRLGLERQRMDSAGSPDGSGLRYLPVIHEGSQSSSPEEADRIRDLVQGLLKSGAAFTGKDGNRVPVGLQDILIIAPYNAQVFELQDRIPGGRIGTIDKFQGQQTPVVVYSMTTSTHAECAARNGISLQPEPAQRRDITRKVRLRPGRLSSCTGNDIGNVPS